MHVLVNRELGKIILEVDSRQHILTPAEAKDIGRKLVDCAEVVAPSAVVQAPADPHDPPPADPTESNHKPKPKHKDKT